MPERWSPWPRSPAETCWLDQSQLNALSFANGGDKGFQMRTNKAKHAPVKLNVHRSPRARNRNGAIRRCEWYERRKLARLWITPLEGPRIERRLGVPGVPGRAAPAF